jgi:heme-degrading monooxygenase HmoA
MLALLFEVIPKPDAYQRYLDIAAGLRPALEKMEGFLFIDRFRSLADGGTILSHSLWRDEAALAAWRTFEPHHHAQARGREEIFLDYRIRIAQVVREELPGKPAWHPVRLTSYRDPAAHVPRVVVIAASTHVPCGTVSSAMPRTFESLNRPGEFLALYEVTDRDAALKLAGDLREHMPGEAALGSVRICEVERDYTMFDRHEAPQYYPPVPRTDRHTIER